MTNSERAEEKSKVARVLRKVDCGQTLGLLRSDGFVHHGVRSSRDGPGDFFSAW